MKVSGLSEARVLLRRYFQYTEEAALAGLAAGGKAYTEPWERAQHVWINRTGDAERGLHTSAAATGRGYTLFNAHGVPYGRYLETKHDGRYAILAQALRATWPQVLGEVQREMKERVRR